VLIEDCLTGDETSILVIVSGRDYLILPTSQDHKRIGEGDTGPNTGGMGTYSPAEVVTPALLRQIEDEIVRPSVEGIAEEGIDFRGTLFIGIMLTSDGPSVLEYNTRFGDPETQVVLPRLDCDVLELLWRASIGQLAGFDLQENDQHAMCVVIASRGYPESYPRGDVINLPDPLPANVALIQAGTANNDAGQLVTAGGRVLGVTALADSLKSAADLAYSTCEQIDCVSKVYRRDIGARQFNRE
jgi:phosphoribosylamine--glycine ligase